MFNKKILRLIGLLLIGSQFLLLANTVQVFETSCDDYTLTGEINDCKDVTDGNVIKYCIQGTNIYALPESGRPICKVALTASSGINVIKVDGVKSAEITLSSTNIATEETYKNLVILNCDAESCIRTTGYVKGSTENYYAIYDGTTENIQITPSTGCGNDNIGGIAKSSLSRRKRSVGKPVLCYGNKQNFDTEGKYVLKIGAPSDESTIFSDSPFNLEYNSNYVISVDPNYIVFDNLVYDEIFSEYDTSKVLSKSENICNGNVLNSMYSCSKGVCTSMELPLDGTYLYTGTSKLYTFSNSGKTCTEGLYKNGESVDGVMAFNKDVFDDDPNAFIRLSAVNDFTLITDVQNIVLKYCSDGLCINADGFVKYGTDSNFVGRCSDGSCSTDLGENINCDNSNNLGELKYDVSDGVVSVSVCIGKVYDNDGNGSKSDVDININDDIVFLHDQINDQDFHGWKFIADTTGNAYAFKSISLSEGYYNMDGDYKLITTVSKEGYLLLCTLNEKAELSCKHQTTIGYYKNAGESKTDGTGYPYIKCGDPIKEGKNVDLDSFNKCEIIANPSEVECTNENLGQFNGGKLCLGLDPIGSSALYENHEFIKNTGYSLYLTDINSDSSIFKEIKDSLNDDEKENTLFLIKITSNAMIYYNNQSDNQPVCMQDTDGTLTAESGCISVSTCSQTGKNCIAYVCSAGKCKIGEKIGIKCKFETGEGEDCVQDNYWLVRDDDVTKLEHFLEILPETPGYLFHCPGIDTNGNPQACIKDENIGYFVKSSETAYYACNGDMCIDFTTLESNCSSDNTYVGKLFKNANINNNKLSICLGIEKGGVGISAELKDYSKEAFNAGKYALANSETTSYVFKINKIIQEDDDQGKPTGIDSEKYGMVDIYENKVIPKTNWRSSVIYAYANSGSYEIVRKTVLNQDTCSPVMELEKVKDGCYKLKSRLSI